MNHNLKIAILVLTVAFVSCKNKEKQKNQVKLVEQQKQKTFYTPNSAGAFSATEVLRTPVKATLFFIGKSADLILGTPDTPPWLDPSNPEYNSPKSKRRRQVLENAKKND